MTNDIPAANEPGENTTAFVVIEAEGEVIPYIVHAEDAHSAAEIYGEDYPAGCAYFFQVYELAAIEVFLPEDEDNDMCEALQEVSYEMVHVYSQATSDCSEDEHDWQRPHHIVGGIKDNPGVWGKGAGVEITECCMHCGDRRVTTTNVQRGSFPMHDIVRIDEGYFADRI